MTSTPTKVRIGNTRNTNVRKKKQEINQNVKVNVSLAAPRRRARPRVPGRQPPPPPPPPLTRVEYRYMNPQTGLSSLGVMSGIGNPIALTDLLTRQAASDERIKSLQEQFNNSLKRAVMREPNAPGDTASIRLMLAQEAAKAAKLNENLEKSLAQKDFFESELNKTTREKEELEAKIRELSTSAAGPAADGERLRELGLQKEELERQRQELEARRAEAEAEVQTEREKVRELSARVEEEKRRARAVEEDRDSIARALEDQKARAETALEEAKRLEKEKKDAERVLSREGKKRLLAEAAQRKKEAVMAAVSSAFPRTGLKYTFDQWTNAKMDSAKLRELAMSLSGIEGVEPISSTQSPVAIGSFVAYLLRDVGLLAAAQ